MIKSIDMQVMTNRTTEYTKDVSQQLKQADHMREAATQTQRADVQREAESVVRSSKSERAIVQAQDERREPRQGKKRDDRGKAPEPEKELLLSQSPLPPDPEMARLPNVGYQKESVLDIEV